MNIYFNYKST